MEPVLEKKQKKYKIPLWGILIIFLVILAAFVFLIWWTVCSMFAGNSRFTLQKVFVESSGYWKGRRQQICEILRIRPGSTNLFQMDPKMMRERLLQREASIQRVEVRRILPDTLNVSILERIPVALINTPRSLHVVDSESVLMYKNRCMNISYSLPVIVGLRNMSSYPVGSRINALDRAVELIMLTKTAYPSIRIRSISIQKPGQLVCAVYYKHNVQQGEMFRVVMPDTDLNRKLQELVAALEDIRKKKEPRRNINLMFRGMAIITSVRDISQGDS